MPMSERITAANLETVVKRNLEIQDEVQKEARQFLSTGHYVQSQSKPQLALTVLKLYGLVQLPVNDSYWSGALFVKEGKTIPVINTALPRANQYFAAWHEIYHIFYDKVGTNHFIETETTVDERKADYFASFMLLYDVMNYYSGLKNTDFLSRVFNCMSVFQAPYKAVLISLFEEAVKSNNEHLKALVKENFDRQFDDMPMLFRELGLDDSLVRPSNVINCDRLKDRLATESEREPDLEYHKDNAKFLDRVVKEIKITMEDNDG